MCTKKIGVYQMDLTIKLGRGAYGDVYPGQDKNGLFIAIKQIALPNKDEKEVEKALNMAKNEISVMRTIQDVNVVKFVDMVRTQNNLYLMMEYCNGGSLDKYICKKCSKDERYLAEKEAKIIMKQIVSGYNALYQRNIVHRDLKSANILIHDGVVKIADFGFSKFLEKTDEQLLYTYAGSPLYMAPQILQQKQYTNKADVWSMGIIFYEILFGKLPWHAITIPDLINKIKNEELHIPQFPVVSDLMKELIKKMLQKEEADRICWKDVQNHAYFNEQMEFEYLTNLRNSYNEIEEETDELKKSNAKKNIYFQQQNVVQHVYHAEQIQDQIQNACPGILEAKQEIKLENHKKNRNLDQMYKKQKEKVSIQSQMQLISDWVVHRKNKSAFVSLINSQLYDQFQQNLKTVLNEQLFWGFLFLLTKYQNSILFKMKCRLCSGRLDSNNQRCSAEDWKKFCKSKEGQTSLKVIEHDFQVINQFWDSIIPETLKSLQGTQDQLLLSILKVCNKNQIEKQSFDCIFKNAAKAVLEAVKLRIIQQKNNISLQLLRFGQHLQNSLDMNQLFKFKGPKQIDFFKYYEQVENFTTQQILQKLNIQL
ncbi:unnamed protein product (macronuclear) [Paramecium tetraurelia]|uniref:Protein kinase domain-containing protein n=1 Tax=Paramecium tetraurelia TaxID=5888 RepID=A0CDN0_PARTE|nr:uncharacterized protein GSPATT00007108001 [Paramecium tetraurelia]CAK68897.1 unnamed protein product [Paramecium tetraurelia]|eukprot:XP_001436294.1 hypothetical protein (macronuclear) [Paramecium tetraurelia strain d4-2]